MGQGMGPRRECSGSMGEMEEASEIGHGLEVPCKDAMD